MNNIYEYANFINFIETKRNELLLLNNKHNFISFIKRKKLEKFIKKYDNLLYLKLLKFENIIQTEYELMSKINPEIS